MALPMAVAAFAVRLRERRVPVVVLMRVGGRHVDSLLLFSVSTLPWG